MPKSKYNHLEIEKKWQKIWEDTNLYKTSELKEGDKKRYILEAFPYPSGDGLHVGHVLPTTAGDVTARYSVLKGFKVLHPIGWDAFGLPTENFAKKKGLHPQIVTNNSISNFKAQIKRLGVSYDWDREVNTSDPDYYKWTQWFFQLLYKRGLAYKKEALVNWDPVDKTVLANEQVLPDGTAERSGAKVEQKMMSQWFFKITDYAERLLNDLDELDWPESTKQMQRNWIGKSIGAEVDFDIENTKQKITVFTTAHDTIFGVSFIVLSPEHPLVQQLVTLENKQLVSNYQNQAKQKSTLERTDLNKDKSGIFTGSFAINPINGVKVPIYIADYVLSNYGTGAVMGVPGEDERDFEFATKYNLAIIYTNHTNQFVSYSQEIKPNKDKYTLINSDEFNGLTYKVAREQILQKLINSGAGRPKITYRLRDWSIGRQRYWGCPIPIYYNQNTQQNGQFGEGNTILIDAIDCLILEDEQGLNLNSELFNFLKDLPQRKIIVTNASNKVLARIKQLTINTGFEVFSYEANPLKESPEYFKQLIQELDLDISRTFYFDHDIKNVIAAQQVSIDSILYLNNQQIIDIIQDRNKRIRLIPGAIEEEPTKILFASTNMNKIQRFKDLTQELNLEVFSLTDLGLDKLPEPEENGESEIENATIKAKHYWQHLIQKMPVISQDDGVYNSGLPKEYQAGKDIKATVAKFIGQSDRKSIFLYWKMLAEKFNNPSITFRWSFAIYDGSKTDSTNCNVDGVLMAIPAKNYQEFIDSGAPISPLMQMDLGSQKIYFSNLKKVDYKELAHQNCSSLLELLGKQIKKNISTESLIPEQDLPLLLPQDLDMSSGMIKPLSQNHEFINSAAKKYGEGAKYEADTMDTFVCSSWYYFRYCSPNNQEVFADKHEMEKWMPVDQYIIGAEHSTLHLLYARFFTKVLFDAGFINFEEPFIKMRHQGLILGPDNQKMSKSKGNVVNPNEVFDEYGADTLRMYEMFMGPFDQPKPWSTSSIKGVRRLLERVWNLQERVYYYKDEVMDKLNQNNINYGPQNENTIEYGLHKLIKKVGVDIESFSFNTSVAEYMKFMNLVELTGAVTWHQLLRFLIVLHPFAPFITEEIYHNLDWEHIQEQTKNQCLPKQSISQEQFPSYSEKYLIQDTVKMVVQINGKVRAEFEIDTNIDENIVLEQAKIAAASYLEGKTIKFSKVVPNKLVSFVIQ